MVSRVCEALFIDFLGDSGAGAALSQDRGYVSSATNDARATRMHAKSRSSDAKLPLCPPAHRPITRLLADVY